MDNIHHHPNMAWDLHHMETTVSNKSWHHKRSQRPWLLLTPKVTDLYNEKSKIELNNQYVFSEDISSMLDKPTATIKQWLHRATLRVKASKDWIKAKIRARHKSTSKIHPFFSNSSNHSIVVKHKPMSKPKNTPRLTSTTLLTYFAPTKTVRKTETPKDDLLPLWLAL
jgi:hypothetical protein